MQKFIRGLAAAVGWAAFTVSSASAQPAWPQQPIKIVVAYPAGSTGDNVMRLMTDKLSQKLGQPVIIDNRAGAGGNIGASAVAHAKPDGYTLLVAAANNFAINQFLYPSMGFDPLKAFEPIAVLVDVPSVVFINTAGPAKTFQEFARHAQARGSKLNYASPGVGTPPHLAAELINQSARLGLVHVPYKGSPSTVSALLSNEVQMILAGAGVGAPHVKAGKLRAIAVGASQRIDEFPGVPTLAELGMPEVKASTWWGLAAPKGTSQTAITKLHQAVREVLTDPGVARALRELGAVPMQGSPQDMTKLVAQDSRYWQPVVKKLGIRLD